MSKSRCEELYEKVKKNDQEALDELTSLAASDIPNIHAANILGICYENGYIVEKNRFTAGHYYRRAMKHGSGPAYYNHALSFLYPAKGSKKDPDTAAELFINAAKLNHTSAIEKLKQLANDKNKKAITYLGVCFENGYCVPKDINSAISYYRQAANLGDDAGMCHLARLQLKDATTTADIMKGMYLYKQAAMMKTLNPEGSILAIEKLKEMANKDCVEQQHAAHLLGVCYYYGYTAQRDFLEAFRYMSKAALNGTDQAKSDLAILYLHGQGTSMNVPLFAYYALEAAKESTGDSKGSVAAFDNLKFHAKKKDANPSVLHALALCYLHGYSTPKDVVKSKELFERAALLNHGPSCYQLGLMCMQGPDKNLTTAVDYFYQSAQFYYAKDLEENIGLQKLEELAASLDDYPLAVVQQHLSNCYLNGYAVEKDIFKSLQWLYRCNELYYRCMLINWSKMTESNVNQFTQNFLTILGLELQLMKADGLDIKPDNKELLIPEDKDQTRRLFTLLMVLRATYSRALAQVTCNELKKFDHPVAQRLAAYLQRIFQVETGHEQVMKRLKNYLLNLKTEIQRKIDNNEFQIWRWGAWRKGVTDHAILIRNHLTDLNENSSHAEIQKICDVLYASLVYIAPDEDRHPSSTKYYAAIPNALHRMELFYDPMDNSIGMPQTIAIPHSLISLDESLDASVRTIVQNKPLPDLQMPSLTPPPSYGDFPVDYQPIYPAARYSSTMVLQQAADSIIPRETLERQAVQSTAAILSAMPPTTVAAPAIAPVVIPQQTPPLSNSVTVKQTAQPALTKEVLFDWMNLLAPPMNDPYASALAPVPETTGKVAVLEFGKSK